jgi:hypothetical protein
MSTHLSRHFEARRLASGLEPGQLARLAGCTNVVKNGNRVRQFERTGAISAELLHRLAAALEVDPATVERLAEQDRREFLERWLQWVNEPTRPYLVVRLMAAIYSERPVPAEIITLAEAEAWASAVARREHKRCCLVWCRRLSCWFDHDGTLERRTEATPGKPNVPWMRIGGKTFTFGADPASTSLVDWPKRPPGPQRETRA